MAPPRPKPKPKPKRRRSPFQRHRYLGAWRERFVLRNGRQVVLRPIQPADARALRDGFALLSAEEVRMRFLHPLKELSPELTSFLTHVDAVRSFALVVAEPLPPGEALVGAVVRASRHDDGSAEFAILVARPLGGQGLGTYLLKKILRWCRQRGVTRMWGDVLLENDAMLHLVGRMGFRREHVHGEGGIVRVIKELPRPRRRRARARRPPSRKR
jgi:RimJ/RimL family protein N-acetyltransferase